MRKLLMIKMMFIFLLTGTYANAMDPMVTQKNKMEGKMAPDFSLSDMEGTSNQMSKIRGGKRAILFFWATWCPHCRTQIKELQINKDKIAADNIELVLIDLGEDRRQVGSYLKQNGIDLKVLLDERGEVGELFDILGLPTFVFIDQEGVVSGVSHHLPDDFKSLF